MTKQRKAKKKQPVCRICRKRPPWRYKNCPPDICKRCYHRNIWPDRPEARAERALSGFGEDAPVELRYDGYSGTYIEVGRRGEDDDD